MNDVPLQDVRLEQLLHAPGHLATTAISTPAAMALEGLNLEFEEIHALPAAEGATAQPLMVLRPQRLTLPIEFVCGPSCEPECMTGCWAPYSDAHATTSRTVPRTVRLEGHSDCDVASPKRGGLRPFGVRGRQGYRLARPGQLQGPRDGPAAAALSDPQDESCR